jgi:hypothetical protein
VRGGSGTITELIQIVRLASRRCTTTVSMLKVLRQCPRPSTRRTTAPPSCLSTRLRASASLSRWGRLLSDLHIYHSVSSNVADLDDHHDGKDSFDAEDE